MKFRLIWLGLWSKPAKLWNKSVHYCFVPAYVWSNSVHYCLVPAYFWRNSVNFTSILRRSGSTVFVSILRSFGNSQLGFTLSTRDLLRNLGRFMFLSVLILQRRGLIHLV